MPAERLDHFMARANAIYYASRDPFADFTTAPEISQVFGEVLGLWSAVTWSLLGQPVPLALIEAGPGRGTLMQDATRAIRQAVPDFAAALRVHFVETSPRLRAAQAARVPHATWHTDLGTIPDAPFILLANEFLDALPMRQFVRRGDTWTERYVETSASPTEPARAGHWRELPANLADIPPNRTATEGQVVELNEPARAFITALAARLRRHPGAGLFIDYGPANGATGDSLQALANKQPVDPLSLAGAADLTAHVDFADLAGVACAAGLHVQGPTPQGTFLTALGLSQRTARLARAQPPEKQQALGQAADRLTNPAAMGHLFKALAIASPGCPALPGFPA